MLQVATILLALTLPVVETIKREDIRLRYTGSIFSTGELVSR